jgi:polyferredoxin
MGGSRTGATLNPKLTRWGRAASQLLFLAITVWVAYGMFHGVRGATIEKYCPFGGVETLLPWLNGTGTICSLSTINLSILIGVLAITLLFKRVFCSHICPVGTISEGIAWIRRKTPWRKKRIPEDWDRTLKWIKYPLLGLIVYLTYQAQELIFREFDPFYVLFTLGQGHGIDEGLIGLGAFALWVVVALLLLGLVVPLFFCRYLCPFAACLVPFSRVGILKIRRDPEKCTNCGHCDTVCDWGINVSGVNAVTTGECSNCQECIRSCPISGSLELGVGGIKR